VRRVPYEPFDDLKVAKHGHLLGLMRLHPVEDAVEGAYGFDHVRTFVEHNAFGSFAHRGIGHLGPCGQSGLGEALQYLGGPDGRKMGGLAQPENLFLHLGEPLEADLHRQVAARDHYTDGRSSEGREEKAGKLLEGVSRFDLDEDAHAGSAHPSELGTKVVDVARAAYE
jgi:hypothetical protein